MQKNPSCMHVENFQAPIYPKDNTDGLSLILLCATTLVIVILILAAHATCVGSDTVFVMFVLQIIHFQ